MFTYVSLTGWVSVMKTARACAGTFGPKSQKVGPQTAAGTLKPSRRKWMSDLQLLHHDRRPAAATWAHRERQVLDLLSRSRDELDERGARENRGMNVLFRRNHGHTISCRKMEGRDWSAKFLV